MDHTILYCANSSSIASFLKSVEPIYNIKSKFPIIENQIRKKGRQNDPEDINSDLSIKEIIKLYEYLGYS